MSVNKTYKNWSSSTTVFKKIFFLKAQQRSLHHVRDQQVRGGLLLLRRDKSRKEIHRELGREGQHSG